MEPDTSSLISVIVPAFNAESYLSSCIKSIQEQTYPLLEILVIDDGSIDSTGDIADRLALSDSRIRVFHQKNCGVSRSRNMGIRHSNGDFLCFIDADDRIESSFLEELMNSCLLYSTDFSFCDILLEEKDRKVIHNTWSPCNNYSDTIHAMFLDGWGGVSVNKLYRKKFLCSNNIHYPEDICYCEDFVFSAQVLLSTTKISKIQKPLYIYNRCNEYSSTYSFNKEKEESGFRAFGVVMQFLKENGRWEDNSKEIYWRILLNKIGMVFNEERFHEFNTVFPEANNYIWGNPFLHRKLQIVMAIIYYRQYWLARIILHLYQKVSTPNLQ